MKKTGSEEYGHYFKALITGLPGSGKTLISSTASYPLYASAEAGLMSVADRNVPFVEIKNSEQLREVFRAANQPPEIRQKAFGHRVDTLVVDTIDEIQKILIKERLSSTKKEMLAQQDWGWLSSQMQAIVGSFRNLDMNVIFTCHLKVIEDSETGATSFGPALQGSFKDEIPAFVDLVGVIVTRRVPVQNQEKIETELQRVLITEPSVKYPWLKDRSGKLPGEWPVDFVDDFKRIEQEIFSGVSLPDTEVLHQESETETVLVETASVDKTTGEILESSPITQEKENKEEEKETTLEEQGDQVHVPDCPKGKKLCSVSEDQKDLSMLRFKKVLCAECFKEAKAEDAKNRRVSKS